MKKVIKEFCLRGLLSMGFGPIIYGIVMFILYLCNVDTMVDGLVIFKGVISISIMAFLIAGFSIIWKQEEIQLCKKILVHFIFLYVLYLIVYLANDWIEKDLLVIGIFTLVFVLGYLLTRLVIYLVERNRAEKFNKYIK